MGPKILAEAVKSGKGVLHKGWIHILIIWTNKGRPHLNLDGGVHAIGFGCRIRCQTQNFIRILL